MKSSDEIRQLTVELLMEINKWSQKKDRATQEVSKNRVLELIELGADVNGTENIGVSHIVDMTNALKLAANVGSIDIFNILIDKGAHLNTDVLRIAVCLGHTQIVRIMLDQGVEIDGESSIANNRTTMALAAQSGYTDIMTELIKNGGAVNSTGKNILGPLEASVYIKDNQISTEVVEVLLNAGAEINEAGLHKRTPLMRAVLAGQEGVVRILSAALKERGYSIEARDEYQDTALMLAVRSKNVGMARDIIAAGASADAKDINGNSAISLAAFDENIEILELLTVGAADVESANNFGQTPFMLAVVNKKDSVVSWFLNDAPIAININATSQGGWTPLMAAINHGYCDIVVEIMSDKHKNFLDVNAATKDNHTALSLAKQKVENGFSSEFRTIFEALKERSNIEMTIDESSGISDLTEEDTLENDENIGYYGIKKTIMPEIKGVVIEGNKKGPFITSVANFVDSLNKGNSGKTR